MECSYQELFLWLVSLIFPRLWTREFYIQLALSPITITSLFLMYKKNKWGLYLNYTTPPFWIYSAFKGQQWLTLSILITQAILTPVFYWIWTRKTKKAL